MEFVQYHPTGLPFTGILITEAARAEGGWLLNKDGYRYLQDYDLGKPTPNPVLRSMELGPRDRLSQAFVHEQEKGRTIDTPYGAVVHLDLRHLGEKIIDTKLPFVRELCLKYENIDPVHELVPVRPVVHYMMGGSTPTSHGATDAARALRRRRGRVREHQRRQPAGLQLAAGTARVRCAGGTRRRGARSAGRAVGDIGGRGAGTRRAAPARTRTARHAEPGGRGATIADIRTEMQTTMEDGAGIYRSGGLVAKSAAETIGALQERFADAVIDDHSRTFNTELVAALELACMLDVAESILASALRRQESRGAHQRTDFPGRDDERYLAHSVVHRDAGGDPRVTICR